MDKKRIIIIVVGVIILALVSFFTYKLFSSSKHSSTPSCTKQCDNKNCGDDGCNGSCGVCKNNESCVNGKCTPSAICSCDGKECGSTDGCGNRCCPLKNDPNYDCSSCQCQNNSYLKNNQCIKCPDNSKPNTSDTDCDCLDSFYKKDGICIKCPYPASKVNDQSDGCICLPPYYKDKDGNCIKCPDNSSVSKDGLSCICNNSYFMSNGACQLCGKNSHSSDDRKSCICDDGFYKDNNGICQSCPKNSKSNSDNTGCVCNKDWYGDQCDINCDPQDNCNWNNGPVCKDGFYTKMSDEPIYCESQCNLGGVVDKNNPNKCICPENANNLPDGSCQCNVGFYFDGSKCISKTGKCNNKGTFNETTKKCDCNPSYYGDACTEYCNSPNCTWANNQANCSPDWHDIGARDPTNKDITIHCSLHCADDGGTVVGDKCICNYIPNCKNGTNCARGWVGSDCSVSCNCDPNNTASTQLSPDGKSCLCICKDGYGCKDCSVAVNKRCNNNGTWNCETNKCECDPTKDLLPNCSDCCSKINVNHEQYIRYMLFLLNLFIFFHNRFPFLSIKNSMFS